jgi:threonine dehydrogenase-like Zn-dependent dehydrogenase
MVRTVLLHRTDGDEAGTPGVWTVEDQPDTAPTDLPLAGGGLSKVKTDAVGVCGTDFHAFYGKQVRWD